MNIQLHHFFILVEPGAEIAERLKLLGMLEGTRNTHPGQGTSNRRFHFSNGTLELLWIHDEQEAINGPGRDLLLPERRHNAAASPFGVILCRKDKDRLKRPFDGWRYSPEYFDPPLAFHVGTNSKTIIEPLCVYMPFIEPETLEMKTEQKLFRTVSRVRVTCPSNPMSGVLSIVGAADRLSISHGSEHLMEVTFDNHRFGNTKDFRPEYPLIINW